MRLLAPSVILATMCAACAAETDGTAQQEQNQGWISDAGGGGGVHDAGCNTQDGGSGGDLDAGPIDDGGSGGYPDAGIPTDGGSSPVDGGTICDGGSGGYPHSPCDPSP